MMRINKKYHQLGFSLIELLIGLVISLVATLAISTVFSQYEAGKRRVAAGADAQTNGSLALYNIQRDAQNAGFGLPLFSTEATPLNCPLSTTIVQDGVTLNLSPVLITDGGNASDTLIVRYGNNNVGGAYDTLNGNITINNTNVTGVNLANSRVRQFALNDVILIQQLVGQNPITNLCSLAKVERLNGNNTIASLNGLTVTAPAERVTQNATWLSDLGQWNEYRFTVNNTFELTRTGGTVSGAKFPDSSAVPMVSDIVALQAQYGVSADLTTNQVTNWVDATGDFGANMTLANRNRIKAVRVAVVARDGVLQKNNVSQACNTNVANLIKVCVWNNDNNRQNVSLSTIPNWQRYRYKVFETAIPIRSMLWNLCDINGDANNCA